MSTSRKSVRAGAVVAALSMLPLASALTQTSAAASVRSALSVTTYHVAVDGSDGNAGTAAAPFKTVQKAVDRTLAGDTVLVHSGTYEGGARIFHGGTSSAPITLTSAGDGPVTLSTHYAPPPCDSKGPTADRTLKLMGNASYWIIKDLNIVGGILLSGKNAGAAQQWLAGRASAGDWQARRALPGRGVNDPVAARNLPAVLGAKLGVTITPVDGVQILNNTITQRGVQVAMARYGTFSGNVVRDTQCGVGPGLWTGTGSDGWTITNNTISNIGISTLKHYMQEGIRVSDMASYSTVSNNLVTDLEGDGRAITADVDASWNTYSHNVARRVAMGFNDQMAGWGNVWTHNTVTEYRAAGFSFRMMDWPLVLPSMNSSSNGTVVTCNESFGDGNTSDMAAGGVKGVTFTNNRFATVRLPATVKAYWTAEGNRFNGSSLVPALHPAIPDMTSC